MVEWVSWSEVVESGDADSCLAVLKETGARRVEMREALEPLPAVYIAVLEFVDHWDVAAALSPLEALERLTIRYM